jgi:hypothetical protein
MKNIPNPTIMIKNNIKLITIDIAMDELAFKEVYA